MSPVQSREDMERRRLHVAEDFLAGRTKRGFIARKYGVSRTTASRWLRTLHAGESMARRKSSGRPPRLTAAQVEQAQSVFRSPAGEHGFRKWTCQALATWLEREFCVRYDADHVGKLILKWGLRSKQQRRPR